MSPSLFCRSLGPLAWTAGLLSLLVACRDTTPQVVREAETGPLVADSSKLRIVEDTAPAWGASPQWTIGDTPSLDLGDPQQSFLGIAPVVRLSDGHIVVADGSQQTIRYFDAAGKLLATVGGRGAEDGKFHGLGWIGQGAGDTVVAYDFIARRLVVFDGKGKYVRGAALMPADPQASAEPLLSFPDGSVLFRLSRPKTPFPRESGTVMRDSAAYMRFGLDGTPLAAMGEFPQGETFGVQVRPGAPNAPFPVPFGLVTVVALRADTMLIGTGARFEVASIGPDGTPLAMLRAAIARKEVTPEETKAYTAAAITRLKAGAVALKTSLDSNLFHTLERAPFPAQRPAFGRILVDRTGALWVSAPLDPPAPPTSWTVFSPGGAWLGTVTTPEGLEVSDIGSDYVLGVWREPHGQERVRMYPLSRGAGS